MKDDAMENMKELHPDDIEMVAGGADINDSLEGIQRLESIRRAAGMLREESLRSMRNTLGRPLESCVIEEAVNKTKR